MKTVSGRVISPPKLMLSPKDNGPGEITIDPKGFRNWNYKLHIFHEAVKVDSRWALIDLTKDEWLVARFIRVLKTRSSLLGMDMRNPVILDVLSRDFSSASRIRTSLQQAVNENRHSGPLQIIICIMTSHFDHYDYFKWISETQIGVMTQCCKLFKESVWWKAPDMYCDNLCMKINQKLGGRNMELNTQLILPSRFSDKGHVMFIGAHVNHPNFEGKIGGVESKSIAAVVGTTKWHGLNRYIARLHPQTGRQEQIEDFGAICLDLINNFSQQEDNIKQRPNSIVVFRDGVGEGQFDMVLNKELSDMKKAISESDSNYKPKFTVIVAQKRHHTRVFLNNEGEIENMTSGTVLDRGIVHPYSKFGFYLCSQQDTSKPTYYQVLIDENDFTPDELYKLIYHLCFTQARCSKPVSLVTPVYYAHLAAYRGGKYRDAVKKIKDSDKYANLNFENWYQLHQDIKNAMFFL